MKKIIFLLFAALFFSCEKAERDLSKDEVVGVEAVTDAFKNALQIVNSVAESRVAVPMQAQNELVKLELESVCYGFLEQNDIAVSDLWLEGTVWRDENGNYVDESDVVIQLAALLSCAIEEYQYKGGLLLDGIDASLTRVAVTDCLARTFGIDAGLYAAFKGGMTKMAIKRLAVTLSKQLVRHWMPAVGVVVSVGIFTACMYGY